MLLGRRSLQPSVPYGEVEGDAVLEPAELGPRLLERPPRRSHECRPNGARMRDPQHPLVPVAPAELEQSGHHPRGELLVCLAFPPPGPPGNVGALRITRADL